MVIPIRKHGNVNNYINIKHTQMNILKKSILTITLSFLFGLNITAQNKQDKIQYAIELANEEYKNLIRFNMNFSEGETSKFWTVLNEYLNDKNKVLAKEVTLFTKDYNKMNNEEAEDFMEEMFKYEKKSNRIKTKYFGKIRKILPAKKFLRFVQIDNYIETARNFKISSQMPLVRG